MIQTAPVKRTLTPNYRKLSEQNFDRADRAAEKGEGENIVSYYWQLGAYYAAMADKA